MQAGVDIQQVENKQQAADVRLRTDAYNFAQAEKAAGCLVVVTGDTGVPSQQQCLALRGWSQGLLSVACTAAAVARCCCVYSSLSSDEADSPLCLPSWQGDTAC
jgi:hypothetical protein